MVSRLLLIVFCLFGATQVAQAQVCNALQTAEQLEAVLLQNASAPPDLDVLMQIRTNARALSQAPAPDGHLSAAIATYVASVQSLGRSPEGHTLPPHRRSLRNMMIASFDICPTIGATAGLGIEGDQTHALTGASALLAVFDWRVGVPVTALLLAKLAFVTNIVMAIARRRAARRVRHHCHVDIQVHSDDSSVETKMIDVSAVGAKIRLPKGRQLANTSMLRFAGRSYLIKVIWQNAHFAGVMFKHPLPAHMVAEISAGIQNRKSEADGAISVEQIPERSDEQAEPEIHKRAA